MGYKPQEARVVLPNATKTELVMTGDVVKQLILMHRSQLMS